MTTEIRSLPLVKQRRRPVLDGHTAHGDLYEHRSSEFRCTACAHRCVLSEGGAGACGTRVRRNDRLFVPYGYVAREHVRAVETNTIFHVRPGTLALTFGMYGCDLRCPYCHNHRLSQALRKQQSDYPIQETSPEQLVQRALHSGCAVVCAAYNEPLISAEWTRAIFEVAKGRGLTTALITDGHSTPEALSYMRPFTDVIRIDLKAYTEGQYRLLGGRLQPVLDTLVSSKGLGYWVEVVTLVVPGFNDEADGLRQLGDFIARIDPTIPWHLNAFQPRYRMSHLPRMNAAALFDFAGTAYARGLSFVYVGNVIQESLATTRCPCCHAELIRRHDWQTVSNTVVDGRCPSCGVHLPGLW